MEDVYLSDGVVEIGDYAFDECYALSSITIPQSVTYIGKCVFEECKNLVSITVDDNNSFYDSRNSCNAIIQTDINELIVGCSATVIPETVVSIGQYAFSYCRTLKSIVIPQSVKSIKKGAFQYCSALTSITIPKGVTSIEDFVFYYCESLVAVDIPEGIVSIGEHAFSWCYDLTFITIPDDVITIGRNAFFYCSSLVTISIPMNVQNIGDRALAYCKSLSSITCEAVIPPIFNGNDVFLNTDMNITLYVPLISIPSYESAECWKEFAYIEPICIEENKKILDAEASFFMQRRNYMKALLTPVPSTIPTGRHCMYPLRYLTRI